MGAAAMGNLALLDIADEGDGDDHAGACAGGVATHERHIITVAAEADAGIEFVESLHRIAVADSDGHQCLARGAVHGGNIADGDGYCFVSQMLQRCVHHVEINALDHGLCGDEGALRTFAEHSTVVAFAAGVGGEAIDECDFAEVANFCSSFLIL